MKEMVKCDSKGCAHCEGGKCDLYEAVYPGQGNNEGKLCSGYKPRGKVETE